MKLIKDVLVRKSVMRVHTIYADEFVIAALKKMAEYDIGSLVVLDENARVCGLFSERDYSRRVVLLGRSGFSTKVADVMSSDLIVVKAEDPVSLAGEILLEKRVRHLPVVENGILVGIVSIGDVIKSILSDKDFHIRQLETYIRGIPEVFQPKFKRLQRAYSANQ